MVEVNYRKEKNLKTSSISLNGVKKRQVAKTEVVKQGEEQIVQLTIRLTFQILT